MSQKTHSLIADVHLVIIASNMCHGNREAMTFLHRKDRYRLSGPSGPWIRSRKHRGMSITGQKSNRQQRIANLGCLGHDVISNVQEMAYAVIHSRIRHNPEV